MLQLRVNLQIGQYKFFSVSEMEIVSSWETLTDTCTILLPQNLYVRNIPIRTAIKRGDVVIIDAGYYPNISRRFTGAVVAVVPNDSVEIKCQDSSYYLKQQTVKEYVKSSVTLSQLLVDNLLLANETLSVNLGAIRVQNATKAEMLDAIKEQYGIYSFYRFDELQVGLPYTGQGSTYRFTFSGEECNIIESNLEYQEVEAREIVLRGVLFYGNGDKKERFCYYDGDKIISSDTAGEGAQKSFTYRGITEKEMDKRLQAILPTLSYNGYKGTFTTFLNPRILHGDRIQLSDSRYPERDGTYLVKSVTTMVSTSGGGRQVIELNSEV